MRKLAFSPFSTPSAPTKVRVGAKYGTPDIYNFFFLHLHTNEHILRGSPEKSVFCSPPPYQ